MSTVSAESVVQYFLLNTPAGEIDNVIADLHILVTDTAALSPSTLTPTLRQYNTTQLTHITITDTDASANGKLLVTPYNQVSAAQPATPHAYDTSEPLHDEYIDPNTRRTYHVDHLKRTATPAPHSAAASTPTAGNDSDSQRAMMQKQLETYVSDFYKTNKVVACVYSHHSDLVICISGKSSNLQNYWTGGWTGVYTYSTINNQLTGQLNIDVHYFEDGNVQLHTVHKLEPAAFDTTGDSSSHCKQVIDRIEAFESAYQQSLEAMYENIHENTFKQMRRFLPVTRTKFAWSHVANDTSLFDVMSKSIDTK